MTILRAGSRAAISIVAVVALANPVSAGPSTDSAAKSDPQDSDSRLDIVLVKARTTESGVSLTIRTADPWRSNYVEYEPTVGDTIMARLWWEFDTDRDGSSDLAGHFFWDNGKKRMFFEVYSEERDRIVAKKIDNRTVSVKIPLTYPEFQGRRRVDLRAISVVKGAEEGMVYPFSGERDDAPLGVLSIR